MERGLERGSGLEIESRYLYLEQAMLAESTWCDYVSLSDILNQDAVGTYGIRLFSHCEGTT